MTQLDKNMLVSAHTQFVRMPSNKSLDFMQKGITSKKENNSKYENTGYSMN
jgi:hypothetical protein